MFYNISLILGCILIVAAFLMLRKSLHFIRNSERATGYVIDLERVYGSDGDTYKGIFRFKDHNNKEIIYKEKSSSRPASWAIGEEAHFAYERNNPANAQLLTYFGSFGWTIILASIALPLLLIGGGYYIAQPFLK